MSDQSASPALSEVLVSLQKEFGRVNESAAANLNAKEGRPTAIFRGLVEFELSLRIEEPKVEDTKIFIKADGPHELKIKGTIDTDVGFKLAQQEGSASKKL